LSDRFEECTCSSGACRSQAQVARLGLAADCPEQRICRQRAASVLRLQSQRAVGPVQRSRGEPGFDADDVVLQEAPDRLPDHWIEVAQHAILRAASRTEAARAAAAQPPGRPARSTARASLEPLANYGTSGSVALTRNQDRP